MSSKVVCVVGGGVSGLVAAQTLTSLARRSHKALRVVLLEGSDRLGGQIYTQKHVVPGLRDPVIIEAGAEGFVTRSTLFPKVAEMAGLHSNQLVNQGRVADNELVWDESKHEWSIFQLEPGVAAQKLGFQVPKEDRGRGIRSFESGMSQLVDRIGENLADYRLNSHVETIERDANRFRINYKNRTSYESLTSDAVIVATPLTAMSNVLSPLNLEWSIKPVAHNSHVSVHVVVPCHAMRRVPQSFTVPEALQSQFGGLRACSFVNEKFPNRCGGDKWLFRFYYRPISVETVRDQHLWLGLAEKAFRDVFGSDHPICWSHYAPWESALPVITPAHLSTCKEFQLHVKELTKGTVELIGSEVSGAGLEAAATSGYEAAVRLLDRL